MNRKLREIGIALVVLFVSSSEAADEQWYRWTDVSGTHVIVAKFLSLQDGVVRLKREEGPEITVSLNRLSVNTRALAQSIHDTQSENPFDFVNDTTPEEAQIRLDALVTPGKTGRWGSWKVGYYIELARLKPLFQPVVEVFDDSWKNDSYYPLIAILCGFMGFISWLWMVIAAFRSGTGWGFMILIPCTYILAVIPFLILNWTVAKGPFFLSLIAFVMKFGAILLIPSWALEAGRMEGVLNVQGILQQFNLDG